MNKEYKTIFDEGSCCFQHSETARRVSVYAVSGWVLVGAIQMIHIPNEQYGFKTLATMERDVVNK